MNDDNLDTNHVVTVTEPAWTERAHAYDPDAGEYVSGELKATLLVEHLHDDSTYRCSCGKELRTWEDAEVHMKNPDKITPSEATTTDPDR